MTAMEWLYHRGGQTRQQALRALALQAFQIAETQGDRETALGLIRTHIPEGQSLAKWLTNGFQHIPGRSLRI